MISSRDFLRGKSAVIFDFDGTLGDTIDLWNRVDVVLAGELGSPGLDPRECHAFREAALRRYKNEENPYRCYCGELGKKIGCELSAEEIHTPRGGSDAKAYQKSRSKNGGGNDHASRQH